MIGEKRHERTGFCFLKQLAETLELFLTHSRLNLCAFALGTLTALLFSRPSYAAIINWIMRWR